MVTMIEVLRLRVQPGIRALALASSLVGTTASAGSAQAARDSIPLWTHVLQTGSLPSRDSALASLAKIPIADLPPNTRHALVVELNHLHGAMLSNTPIGSPDDGELFGEYYMQLVGMVASIRTPEAGLALAPAVGVSDGIAKRVARLGDPAVDALMGLLAQHHEESGVLKTLGLAWFWADSTGTSLSPLSRARIVSAFITAAGKDSVRSLLGMTNALREMRDPVFLPLATLLRDRAATLGIRGSLTVEDMSTDVIPTLTALATTRATPDLTKGMTRLIAAVCGETPAGRRLGACESISNDFIQAARHLENGQPGPAHNTLESVAKKVDETYAAGAFNRVEHALLAGNIALLLQRSER
jgi:hypothetical protein